MSSASQRLGTNSILARSDFWELTNFGTNALELSDYRFSDSAGLAGAEAAMFNGLVIGAGESIVFVKVETVSCCKNSAEFRAWWGNSSLPDDLQIYFYTGFGFNNDSDAVQLWQIRDGESFLVQRVDLYEARRGHSFTYDSATGLLDSFSGLGDINVFKAAESDDVGSPGFTAGPAPLLVVRQPQSVAVDAGSPAEFMVSASGLPLARFQWQFNGAPIAGATSNTFKIPAAQPAHEGTYTVILSNGLTSVASAPAILQVNIIPSLPSVVVPPSDLVVTPGQTAIFRVAARGYPLPAYQWRFGGQDIVGATDPTLFVPNVDLANVGSYSVHIQNSLGSANASAVLAVQRKPSLKITEMFGSASTDTTIFGRADWWELTNIDTNIVNLHGYRFDDFPGVLEGAVVVTNNLIIRPGESVLFIQDMTPEFFVEWWGEENLPEHVQFVCYTGNGLRAAGDFLRLWNGTALEESDFIDSAGYTNLDLEDGSPLRGISLTFWTDGFWDGGTNSIPSKWGTIKASSSADIGSPGYITNHPPRTVAPRCLRISSDNQGVHLVWKTQAGKRYELQGKDVLDAPNWTPVSQHTAVGSQLAITDTTAAVAMRRFYRLIVVPSSP